MEQALSTPSVKYDHAEGQIASMISAYITHNLECSYVNFRENATADNWHALVTDMLVYQQWRKASTEKKKLAIKAVADVSIGTWGRTIVLAISGKPLDELLQEV